MSETMIFSDSLGRFTVDPRPAYREETNSGPGRLPV